MHSRPARDRARRTTRHRQSRRCSSPSRRWQHDEAIIASFAELGAPAVEPLLAKVEAADSLEKIIWIEALAAAGEPAFEPLKTFLEDDDLDLTHV